MKQVSLLFLAVLSHLQAQEPPSIHQFQSEYYRDHPPAAAPPVLAMAPRRADLTHAQVTNAVIYGFHPYWTDSQVPNYYFSLLTHLAYFSGEVNPNTGGFLTTRSWATSPAVTQAQQHGVKVHFTVTLFGNHAALLNSQTNRSNLISQILAQITLRNADGCNVDFEGVGASNAEAFRTFIIDLGSALKGSGKELVVELPAVDWGNDEYTSYFFSTTEPLVDYYFLMAYNYWWSGSSTAGPIAPLTTGTTIRHVTRSIQAYLSIGCPAGKLIAGFPYYGMEWPVSTNLRMASVVTSRGSGDAMFYSEVKSLLPSIPAQDRFFDGIYNSSWYRYDSSLTGKWRQGWYDDSSSLAMKYDSVKAYNLAGAGIWALGYDGAHPELWGAIKNAFASSTSPFVVVLDSFETGVGRFDRSPTWSGTSQGISSFSSATWSNDRAYRGQGSLMLTFKDDNASSADWLVRMVSGGGEPSGNLVIDVGGTIGFWLRTTTAPTGATVGMLLDDGDGGTEQSPHLSVINDGMWHYYEFDTKGNGWTSFSSGNGAIDGPTCTIDALVFTAPNQSADWLLHIDDVSFSDQLTGVISYHEAIPEEPLMMHAFPNPFNPSTNIAFRSTTDGSGVLRIFDLLGRHVATVLSERVQANEWYRRWFDGSELPAGVYIARLELNGKLRAVKLVLTK